mgnify:CR=1 FL=1
MPPKPVEAWRDTKKVPEPMSTTPELLAQPESRALEIASKIAVFRIVSDPHSLIPIQNPVHR